MLKISVEELKQLITLLTKTSTDIHVLLRIDGPILYVQFQNAEGQISTAQLYDESSGLYAKLTATESLLQTLTRLKK